MNEALADAAPMGRDTPVVATLGRWAACAAVLAGLFVGGVVALLRVRHGVLPGGWGVGLVGGWAGGAALLGSILRAEETRLSRELRTARTGTPALRSMAIRRRLHLPLLGRWFSTPLGLAAILLADGDRTGARAAVASTPIFMQGGRLDNLRTVVEADIDRASGAPASVDRAIAALRAAPRVGHREVDLYRLHVLVKAVLERGDGDVGVGLAEELAGAADEEERLYATWLRVWFDLDAESSDAPPWPPLAEAEARLATLVARAHGAAQLVDKLEERLLAIAHVEPRG